MKGKFSMKNVIVTGEKGKLSCKVANWLKLKGGFDVRQISLRGNDFENADFNGIECIIHIAGVTPQNAKSETDYEEVNYSLTKRLADKAKQSGVKQFVFISSMAVYGAEQNICGLKGMVNRDTALLPTSEYGKSKLKAEKYLQTIQNADFLVSIIRVPSVFDKEKTEYIDQYKYLAEKLPVIPVAFTMNYKSFINSDNLCELIYLIVKRIYSGVVCPDDGKFSAFDICRFIYPNKPKSKALGKLIELSMKNNSRIIDYYGAIYYSEELTNVFDGEYRIKNTFETIGTLYEK